MIYDLKLDASDILDFARSHNIEIEGTEQDPIVFRDLDLPNIKIVKSRLHIIFEDCNFNQMLLRKCENVQFKQCYVRSVILNKSLGIVLRGVEFKGSLTIINSNLNTISSCKINWLKMFTSFTNKFEECEITHAFNRFSRGNVFTHIKVLDFNKHNLIEGHFGIRNTLLSIVLIGSLLIVVIFSLFQEIIEVNDYFMFVMAILCITLVGGTVLFLLVRFYIDYKKSKEYEPNRLILPSQD